MDKLNEEFIKNIKENYPKSKDKIILAYQYANKAHENIKRKSGEPYIIHPVAVAQILIDNDMDSATIIAGLLHDVVEDTSITLDEIEKKFGLTVAKLVDGVTKIDEMTCQSNNLTEADNLKRLLLAMGEDLRVIFIKLADRLHNMRTIQFLSPARQYAIAKETQELFIPIAERIGIRKIRSELQDLTFRTLYPDEYKNISDELNKKLVAKNAILLKINKKISEILKNNEINAKITSWPEHPYSVFKKRNNQGTGKVYGIKLFKIIVPTTIDCYKALGLLHSEFNPIPGQIKDYISSPKANGYKSIHSSLATRDTGVTFTVMIRTDEMDKNCEYGISSFWKDKDKYIKYSDALEKYNSLKDIIFGEETYFNSSDLFINAIKNDLMPAVTWVFTPEHKPICINTDKPTVIDFAYTLHTDIGNNAIGARVNGKFASLKTILKNGDEVEVLLSEKDKSPSRNWLSIVKTTNARRKISEYIRNHTTKKYVEEGKKKLAEELKSKGYSLGDVVASYDDIAKEFNFVNLEDLYACVGYEGITMNQIESYIKVHEDTQGDQTSSPVEIEGSPHFNNLSFPRCCCPIVGDKIVALVSKNGISIHTADCNNIKKADPEKILKAEWKKGLNRNFNANIKIVAKDRVGLASQILDVITSCGLNISNLSARMVNSIDCEVDVILAVKNKKQLNDLLDKLSKINGVKFANRLFGNN